MERVVLPVLASSWADIARRIQVHGPVYIADFMGRHPDFGPVILFGETVLAIEGWREMKIEERDLILEEFYY